MAQDGSRRLALALAAPYASSPPHTPPAPSLARPPSPCLARLSNGRRAHCALCALATAHDARPTPCQCLNPWAVLCPTLPSACPTPPSAQLAPPSSRPADTAPPPCRLLSAPHRLRPPTPSGAPPMRPAPHRRAAHPRDGTLRPADVTRALAASYPPSWRRSPSRQRPTPPVPLLPALGHYHAPFAIAFRAVARCCHAPCCAAVTRLRTPPSRTAVTRSLVPLRCCTPCDAVSRPCDAVSRPRDAAPRPRDATRRPSDVTPRPSNALEALWRPSDDASCFCDTAPRPSAAALRPRVAVSRSRVRVTASRSSTAHVPRPHPPAPARRPSTATPRRGMAPSWPRVPAAPPLAPAPPSRARTLPLHSRTTPGRGTTAETRNAPSRSPTSLARPHAALPSLASHPVPLPPTLVRRRPMPLGPPSRPLRKAVMRRRAPLSPATASGAPSKPLSALALLARTAAPSPSGAPLLPLRILAPPARNAALPSHAPAAPSRAPAAPFHALSRARQPLSPCCAALHSLVAVLPSPSLPPSLSLPPSVWSSCAAPAPRRTPHPACAFSNPRTLTPRLRPVHAPPYSRPASEKF
ncbi:hypothetical protein DENSPDRAFT_886316 [Dentipellis sp. KUC8613]|nr:hypothetical protein DENSPDRAFT_886316 [Dentipellis sp. KUC8613]